MKNYMSLEQAEYELEHTVVLEYPNVDNNVKQYPMFEPPILNPMGDECKPTQTVREVMDCIGDKPKRILDLGGGIGGNALYLAAHGHDVTTVDSYMPSVMWQNQMAHELGLSNSLRAVAGDVRDLPSQPKYDVIIAEMLLHFMDEADSRKLLAAMRAATLLDGLNIVSAYTLDNPSLEKVPPRNLLRFFEDDELVESYPEAEWEIIRDEVGPSDRHVDRSYIAKGMVLIPSAAELVIKKIAEPKPAIVNLDFTSGTGTTSYVL